MARYQRVMPMVASKEFSFPQIQKLLTGKGFRYEPAEGKDIFRKGDGVWTMGRYISVTYAGKFVNVEAWVTSIGSEMDLEGFVGCAGKKPVKKLVAQVENILSVPVEGFVPQEVPVFESQPAQPRQILPPDITKKEYLKNYAGAEFLRQLKGAAIMGYVCAGINGALGLLNPLALVDALILLSLTLGMHLGKSKGCAICMLIYSICSVVVSLITTGTFSGWLLLVLGIMAVQVFDKAEKRFKRLTANEVQKKYSSTYGK